MYSTLFFVMISAVLVYGKTSYVSVPQDELQKILKVSVDCISKTGVGADTLEKIVAFTFEDTKPVRHYIFCFAKSAGYSDDNGHFVKDKLMSLVGNHKRKAEFGDVIDECNKSVGASGIDKYDTIYKTAVCFHEKSPILFKL